MRYLMLLLLFGIPCMGIGQQITYITEPNGIDFDLEKVNDINNTIPIPVLNYLTIDSIFLSNFYFAELIGAQDNLASDSYFAIVRNQQSNKIFQGFNNDLGITEEMVLDSLDLRHANRLNGCWRYRVVGVGSNDITISRDTLYLGNGNVLGTYQAWGSKRIEVFLVLPQIGGPDTLFLNTPTGKLWAGQTTEQGFHALTHRSCGEGDGE